MGSSDAYYRQLSEQQDAEITRLKAVIAAGTVRIAKSVPCKCEWGPECKETAEYTVNHIAYCYRHAQYHAFHAALSEATPTEGEGA